MGSVHFASGSETYKDIFCSTLKTWVMENARNTARPMCCLVFLLGSTPYDVGSNGTFQRSRSLFLKLIDDSNKRDAENTDDNRNDEYIAPTNRSRIENTENDDTSEEEWMTEDDDNASRQQGSAGHGGDGGDDDDDNNGNDEHSEDSRGEDEDCEEEEEQRSDEDVDPDSLLVHAREVYATDSFCIFEHEYKKCAGLFTDVTDDGEVYKFEASRWGDHSRKYIVTAKWFEGIVNCSCNYFSITGFLCSHAIAILQRLRIERIPDHYLLKWQMKNFSSYAIPDSSFLKRRKCQQPLDDCRQVSSGDGHSIPCASLCDDEISSDFDYIVSPLLRHAKDLYVSESYDMFQKEYRMSEYLWPFLVLEDLNERGIIVQYEIDDPGGRFMVHAEPANGTVNCSCKKFACSGILCSHALHILYLMDIVFIPPQYIVPRLVKDSYTVKHEKIHGPRYPEIESLIRLKVRERRISALACVASRRNVEVDSDFVEGCLGELSPKPSFIRYVGASHNSHKVEAKFLDDQCIRSFTYKKSVNTKPYVGIMYPLQKLIFYHGVIL